MMFEMLLWILEFRRMITKTEIKGCLIKFETSISSHAPAETERERERCHTEEENDWTAQYYDNKGERESE